MKKTAAEKQTARPGIDSAMPSNGGARAVAPLHGPFAKQFVADHLERAQRELRTGPGGLGWKNNESMRPKIEERAAFFSALSEIINSPQSAIRNPQSA